MCLIINQKHQKVNKLEKLPKINKLQTTMCESYQ